VFDVNLLPAFGPPTWAVLVFFRLQSDLTAIPLVPIGALAAASGPLALASAAVLLRLPKRETTSIVRRHHATVAPPRLRS
jgi:hypothetical protein